MLRQDPSDEDLDEWCLALIMSTPDEDDVWKIPGDKADTSCQKKCGLLISLKYTRIMKLKNPSKIRLHT